MALTVSEITRTVYGNRKVLLATVTFDDSYPTGGEALTAATLGFTSIDVVRCTPGIDAGPTVIQCVYSKATSKLLAFRTAAATPAGTVAAHTHTGAAHVHVENEAIGYTQSANTASTTPGAGGSTTPTFTGTAVAAAGLSEVNSTADLSAFSTVIEVIGV